MPFNGSGTFTRIFSWVADKAAGLDIIASRMDQDTNDIAAGLSDCITRDGQSPPSANLPMAGFKLTGVGNATAPDQYAALGQITQNQTLTATGQAIPSGAIYAYINPAIAGPGTYPLPGTPTIGETHWVMCIKGDEDVNNQTIDGNGHTINGKATYSFNFPKQSAGFSFNGTEWSML